MRIVSCNPLELKDPDLPPTFSGYPADDPARLGRLPRRVPTHAPRDVDATSTSSSRSAGAPPLPDLEFIHESPWLNLYLYPAEADYARSQPLAPTWHRLESSVRGTGRRRSSCPTSSPDGEGALIYLSLGSLASADVDLMQRLVEALADSPHRFIVSKGPQHDQYELADNMWGAEFLPQPSILPQVDLVITHGGNNTTTECFHFGKPMIALPVFWDQYDNAQRVDETGFGVRLPTPTRSSPTSCARAIDRLLADAVLHARMAPIAQRLQANPGTERAADLIERLAATHEPVTT